MTGLPKFPVSSKFNGVFPNFSFLSAAYQCTYCDKAYKHSGDLTKHLRIHLGDDMYKCPECPEAFRLPWDLERHSYKHYEEQAANATGATTSHDHEHS